MQPRVAFPLYYVNFDPNSSKLKFSAQLRLLFNLDYLINIIAGYDSTVITKLDVKVR